jgi:hypothetical protein
MQKIINVLSVASFIISASVVGGGIYVFANKDSLIDSAKEKIMAEVGSLAGSAVKDMLPISPVLPEATGGVMSRPTKGLGIPGF